MGVKRRQDQSIVHSGRGSRRDVGTWWLPQQSRSCQSRIFDTTRATKCEVHYISNSGRPTGTSALQSHHMMAMRAYGVVGGQRNVG
ncbi:BZIP family transcription factor [Apiospora arundinis]